MARVASGLLLATLCAWLGGCNQVWGVEPAYLADDAAPPADTGPDPCGPESGVAKLCLTVDSDKAHPTYDVSTGAGGLIIDGSGVLLLFIYDKDPGKVDAKPILYPTYPPETSLSEVRIDDFPVTVPIALPAAGTYWIIGRWQDNKLNSRAGSSIVLGGDFLSVPAVSAGGRFLYAQATVATGTTTKASLLVHPSRRVEVDLVADPSMKTKYKDNVVNGDGPTLFGLYDGDYTTAIFLEYLTMECNNVAPLSATPPTVKSGFVTTVTGNHKLWVAIEDFDTTGTFPPNGTLMTSTDTVTAPTVNIEPSSWTASANAKFVTVIGPQPAGTPDPTHCP
jgi:hypothetical protein